MRPSSSSLAVLCLVAVAALGRPGSASVRVVEVSPAGLTIEMRLAPDPDRSAVGWPRLDEPGQPAVPYWADLLAAPPGAQVAVEVLEAHWTERSGVELALPDPALTSPDAYLPEERATATALGRLAGVPTFSLRLCPYSYNPARRSLRFYDHLRIRVRFVGPPASAAPPALGPVALAGAFLNPEQARAWRRPSPAPKPARRVWYDPSLPWVKMRVEQDGLFRVDPAWLDSLGVDPRTVDPRTLQLYYLGEEQPLSVRGQEDGSFDPGDRALFAARYRREEDRDFESRYGRTDVYWLTWGRQSGRRFAERSGAPVHGYPSAHSYWTTAHFEQDLFYDPLPSAPDNNRDHWFWSEPTRANAPGAVASLSLTRPLDAPDTSHAYQARIRVALHGYTDMGHHTVVTLNGHAIDDRVWGRQDSGQVALTIEGEVSSSYLRGANQLLLQVRADQAEADQVLLNWFEIGYNRLYRARAGYLAWSESASAGRRVAVPGFFGPQVELLDVANEVRFTEVQVDSLDGSWVLSFEDGGTATCSYVAADSVHVRRPAGVLDAPSSWRQEGQGADYVIVTHPSSMDAVAPLAAHRRAAGLRVAVVTTEDLYDEFAYGRFTPEALRDFIAYAYERWRPRPAYVLLAGADHYDYRNILGSRRVGFVPTLYYQSRGRGSAGSDYLYSLVDGDDLLPDLAVGRLAASTPDSLRAMVERIVRYDTDPEPGDWRGRVLYLATYHEQGQFSRACDTLAARYTEPLGFQSVRVYNPDETPLPNPSGKEFLDALNRGALLVNFSGHGSLGTMQFFFSTQFEDTWDYLGQVRNGARLPLVVALSCLNGQFVDPQSPCLAESMTARPEGGAIAYISASAKSYPGENDLLSDRLYHQLFEAGRLEFGPALDAAKAQVLALHPSYETVVRTMQLMGDPAQKLALPGFPDYEAAALTVEPAAVYRRSSARIEARLRNRLRLGIDSLAVLLVGRPREDGPVDTLYQARWPAFAGTRDLAVDWPVGELRGGYRLELTVDPEELLAEIDEGNNRRNLDLEILEPVLPTLVFPGPDAVVAPADLRLEAAVPVAGGPYRARFAVSADPAFPDSGTALSPWIPEVDGLVAYRPEAVPPEAPLFWRVRLQAGGAEGPWSTARSTRSGDPAADLPTWRQAGAQLLAGQVEGLALDPNRRLAVPTEGLPARPSGATREDGFTVRGLKGAGVLCTDGKFVYAKRWYHDASTVYPGTDFFTRVGTGYQGTGRDANYGTLADSTTPGISATYYPDGCIYSECGRAFLLERISVATGELDTVRVPAGLLEWQTGQVRDGHALITSDGRYVYNVAMSSGAGRRTAWGIRVFDPLDGWALVRQFASPPTENAFTFLWTDGIVADGRHLYLIEYGGRRRVRMVDAIDGRFLDEWTSDQDTTRVIGGQYDWVNNKVWLGDLEGPAIYRYAGQAPPPAGRVLSEAIGPARSWRTLRVEGPLPAAGRLRAALLGPGADPSVWEPLPGYGDLPIGPDIDLSGVDGLAYPRLRLRAELDRGAALGAWQVDFDPRSSLQVARVEAAPDSGGARVRVWIRNTGAGPAPPARLVLERSDQAPAGAAAALDSLARGQLRRVQFDRVALPPIGVRLFAHLLAAEPDADPADDRQEVPLLFSGRAPVVFRTWPADRLFLSGDFLPPDQSLLIRAPELAAAHLALALDGRPVQPDSVLAPAWDRPGLAVLCRPRLATGVHRLQVRLFSGPTEVGLQEVRLVVADDLRVGQALVYPHPVRTGAAFTCVLSEGAEVTVELYAPTGRLVWRSEPARRQAGYCQVAWDGRSATGHELAGGTYLYRIAAAAPDGRRAEARGPLVVVR